MEVGLPKPLYRERLQTTLSCVGQKAKVVSVREKVSYKTSGVNQGDEEIKPLLKCRNGIDEIKTEGKSLSRDKLGGNLFIGQVVSGIEVA